MDIIHECITMKMTIRRTVSLTILGGLLCSQATAGIAAPSDSTQAKALLDKLVQAVANAKAFSYTATMTMASFESNGSLGTPHVYLINCREQEPGFQLQTVRQGQNNVAVILCGPNGGLFYDVAQNKYVKFPSPTNAKDYGTIHSRIDAVSDGPDMGDIFDSTLINNPMLDIAGDVTLVSPVVYSMSNVTYHATAATLISENTSIDGKRRSENVYIDANDNLLGYNIKMEIGGADVPVAQFDFSVLTLLKSPLPLSTYHFTLPHGATPFESK
jgi:hypothetical protein